MLENIIAKNFPKGRGVYWFTNENGEIIYVGSSKNLYMRMKSHRFNIKAGLRDGHESELYKFLQNNEFQVKFQLEENYRQLEQKLIEKHNPIFNQRTAFTGMTRDEYQRKYENRDSRKEYKREYCKRDYYKKYKSDYRNQKCLYNGEKLTLHALTQRFFKQGIKHPTLEAKKYLIE